MLPEVLPYLVKSDSVKGATATYEIRIRGAQPYFLVFDEGALTVSSARGNRHVDCRISAEPSAYLLVSTGRVSRWWPTVSGRIFASGRRPWLALGFEKMFASP